MGAHIHFITPEEEKWKLILQIKHDMNAALLFLCTLQSNSLVTTKISWTKDAYC